MNTILLEINKTNTKLITKNKTFCYILGIGKTNYTIHRDADEIKNMYKTKLSSIYKDMQIKDINNYHVFQARLLSIISEIIPKDFIYYRGKKLKIVNISFGIPEIVKVICNKSESRKIESLSYIGLDIKQVNEKLKYIVVVE